MYSKVSSKNYTSDANLMIAAGSFLIGSILLSEFSDYFKYRLTDILVSKRTYHLTSDVVGDVISVNITLNNTGRKSESSDLSDDMSDVL